MSVAVIVGSEAMQAEATEASVQDSDVVPAEPVQAALDPERIETLFSLFECAEERGAWHCVAFYLEGKTFDRIRRFADETLLQRITAWEGKLAKAREYEAVHGPGSLYVMDHPVNLEIEDVVKQVNEKCEALGVDYRMRSRLNCPTEI